MERLGNSPRLAAVYKRAGTRANDFVVHRTLPYGVGGNRLRLCYCGKRLGRAAALKRVKRLWYKVITSMATKMVRDGMFIGCD